MIVWINGAFGVGKTSTARELIGLIPGSNCFDPEVIGGTLRHLLPSKRLAEVSDYQDLPIWRRLVIEGAAAMLAELGGVLVVPMTLLRQEYRDEIFGGLAARRIPVRHVLLTADETILRTRIDQRREPGLSESENAERVRRWAHDRIEAYHQAQHRWLAKDAFAIDNGTLTPHQAAERVAAAVRAGSATVCDIVQTAEPTKETLAAGVLLFDDQDRVLLVDPTYKPGWEFPGGVVEPGEAPARAGVREVREETGLELARVPSLLVVDWEPPAPPAFGGLRMLFDGGRLEPARAGRLRLPGPELRAWRFVTEAEAADLLPPARYARLRWALRARERGSVLNLEDGVPVG
ncbi:NUDIX domain-containing protein [Streptomyces sp. NPDC006879]|uniref:NUDIX hydrolase n=1 Tax=Streptomyces sp. NPDC006879 TaxID=3364767 RepID=UPI00369BEA55